MKHRALYFLPTVIVLSLIVVLGLGVRNRIYDRLIARYIGFIERAETELGLVIDYDSITNYPLNTVRLDGVMLSWHGSTVSVPHLAVRVNLFRIRAQSPLGFLRTITANQIDARIDVETIALLQDQFAGSNDGEGRQFLQLFNGVRFVARNSTVVLYTGASQYAAERVDLSVTLSDAAFSYNGAIVIGLYEAADVSLPFFLRDDNGRMRINFEGVYNVGDAVNNATVRLSEINIAGVAVYPLSFSVRYQQNQWSLTNEGQLRDLRLSSVFSVDDGLLRFNVASDGIDYDQLVIERESEVSIPKQLRGQYSFDFNAVYDLTNGSVEYALQLKVTQNQSTVLQFDAAGDNQQIVINDGVFYSSIGTARLVGAFNIARQTMDGTLAFDQFVLGNSQSMNGVFRITDIDKGLTSIVGNDFTIGRSVIPQITADLQFAPSISNVNISVIFDPQQTQIASLVISNNRNTAVTDLAFSLLRVGVHQIAELGSVLVLQNALSVPSGLAELDTNARIEIAVTADETRLSVPLFNITNRFTGQEMFSFRAAGNQNFVRVDSLILNASNRQLAGSATVRQIAEQIYDFDLSLDGFAQTYRFNARYRRDQFVRFSGTHGLSGVLLFLPQNQLRYNMQLTSLPLHIAESEFILSLNSHGEFHSVNDWRVTLPAVSVIESEASRERKERLLNRRVVPYRIVSSISATPQRISIDRLQFRDHISSFEGDGQVVISGDGAELYFDAQSDQLAEKISLNGYIPFDNSADLLVTAVVEQLNIRHIPQTFLRGAVNSTVSVTRDSTGIVGSVALNSQNIKIGNISINFASRGTFHNTAILMDSIDVYCYGYHVQNGSFEYDIANGSISAAADILQEERLSIIGSTPSKVVDSPYPLVGSRIVATAAIGKNPNTFSNQLKTAEIEIIPMDAFDTTPLSLSVHRDDEQNRYVIAGGDANELTGYIDDNSNIQLLATKDFPVSFSVRGSVMDGLVDMLVKDIFLDVQSMPRLLDLGFLRFTSGRFGGAVRITGDASSLQFYGRIKSDQVGVLTTYIPTEIGPIDTFLILQGNSLQLTEVYARTGEGKGAYFNAAFQLVRGALLDFVVNIRTPDDIVVPFRYDFGVVQVDLDASGAVTLRGSPGFLSVDGVIRGESGSLIARNASNAIVKSEFAPVLSLNLALSTGPQFETLWPSADFPILRAFPELGSSFALSTDSKGIVVVEGEVSFRGGEVFYFDRNFVIREGSVTMRFIDGRLDPLIDLRAEIREYLPRGPVSIYLIIEDDFLSQLNPRLEAIPALSQAEIGSVLGGNIVEVASSTIAVNPLENARIAINLAGDVISRIAVLNDFERSLKEVLGIFDILTIRTQVLQNVIYNILDVSGTSSTQSLAQYLNNTDLFLGTYLAERLFFQLEFGLRVNEQTEYLGGALDELRFSTALSFEFQSPLGILRWNLEPQFQDTFSVDSTVGLSWSVGY